ncbi:MAG TPA: MFS transporter [Streptosporangiaceae bacterium]|nr:MFS transporter [Streptosporangiaceae bacterium]
MRSRDFRVFYAGYVTSLFGSSMSIVAITFAVLRISRDVSDLGLVLAARTVPQVVVLLAGGVAADRFGRRTVMLLADCARCAAQAAFAATLLLGGREIWLFMIFSAIVGTAEGVFGPALSALTVEITPAGELGNANAMFSLAGSTARIAGPALAGLLIAATSPGIVVAIDAASYAASVLALARLRLAAAPRARDGSVLRDLAEGWREFRAHGWLTPTTLQFTFINMLVWGPFLIIGPLLTSQSGGGAAAWGAIMAGYGAGSVVGGLLALGRRPRRPMLVSVAATLGYGLPCAALAMGAPAAVVVVTAVLAGTGSAVSAAFASTAIQQQVPASHLARVRSIQSLAAFSAAPVGLAIAGPVASAVGAGTVLGFAAAWSTCAALAVMAFPSVRRLGWVPVAAAVQCGEGATLPRARAAAP